MKDSAFSDNQFSAIYPPGIEDFYWNKAKNMVVGDVLSYLHPKSILDIGAGRGVVTAYLKGRGFSVWGVERASLDLPKNMEGIVFAGKEVDDIPLDIRQRTDAILLLDVIEHLENPSGIIISAEKALPNLKNIIITVPARQELWSNYDEFNGHYRRYNRINLQSLMTGLGWQIDYNGYYFHALYWPAWLMIKLGFKRNTTLMAPTDWKKYIHSLLAYMFYWEYKLLPRFLVGSSIVAVFKK
jgi:hypothetical protein